MLHSTNEINNKQQNNSKVFFEQYLYDDNDISDNVSNDTSPELDAELLENSFAMRRHFRRIAKHLRNRY